MRIIIKKLLLVTLLSSSILQAMESDQALVLATGSPHTFQPKSLKDYCLATLKKQVVAQQLHEHCAQLNQKIAMQFPKENVDPQLNIEMALRTLLKITQISVENDLMRITPVSIELKNITDDVFKGNKAYYCIDLIETIFPLLKMNNKVIQICAQKIAQHCLYEKDKERTLLNTLPPALSFFLRQEIATLTAFIKQQEDLAYSWLP